MINQLLGRITVVISPTKKRSRGTDGRHHSGLVSYTLLERCPVTFRVVPRAGWCLFFSTLYEAAAS